MSIIQESKYMIRMFLIQRCKRMNKSLRKKRMSHGLMMKMNGLKKMTSGQMKKMMNWRSLRIWCSNPHNKSKPKRLVPPKT
jgi:hypothetical protein